MKVWFITGVSRGLGHALAQAVLEAGDAVIGTSRNGQADLPATERLQLLALDVADREAVTRAVTQAQAVHGRLDVVVNNAGYGLLGAVEEATPAEVDGLFQVNFYGTLHVTQAVLPHLRAQRGGHLINVTSIAGLAPGAGSGLYAASKFAVEGFTQSLAQEVTPWGIRVTLVEPGAFRTDFLTPQSLARSEQPMTEYAETVGEMLKKFDAMNGKQLGDPARAAQALLQLVAAEQPPLHLVLGSDALARARACGEAMRADLDRWEALSRSTDHSNQ